MKNALMKQQLIVFVSLCIRATAREHFNHGRAQLCNRRVPLPLRIARFAQTVAGSLLWVADRWTLGCEEAFQLQRIELRCWRAMLGAPRLVFDGVKEPWPDWFKRTGRAATEVAPSHIGQCVRPT